MQEWPFLVFWQEFFNDLGVSFHQQLAADLFASSVWGCDGAARFKNGEENGVQNYTRDFWRGGRIASARMTVPHLLAGILARSSYQQLVANLSASSFWGYNGGECFKNGEVGGVQNHFRNG